MQPSLPDVKERIEAKVGEYFEEFAIVIGNHLVDGRDVKFSFSATITDEGIEYRASVGVKGVHAPKTQDRFDDPNQMQLEEKQ